MSPRESSDTPTEVETDVTESTAVPEDPAGVACLVRMSAARPSDLGAVFRLEGSCLIGRGEVDLHVDDSGVSRAHARITRMADDRFQLEDLDSRNGSYINGLRMSRAILSEGDRIQLGAATVFRFTRRADGGDSSWQLRQALSAARVATFQLDVRTGEVSWSENIDDLLRLPRGTLYGRQTRLVPLIHADDAPKVEAALRSSLDSGCQLDTEFRLTPVTERLLWVACMGDVLRDAQGSPIRIAGTVMDITEKKRAEQELHRQALIFENLYDGVVTTDEQGRIVDWNPSAERMFGHARTEVIGRTLASLLRPSGGDALNEAILARLRTDGRWTAEIEFIRRDQSTGFCEALVVPLKDASGRTIGSVATHRDVSERKKLQAQLLLAERLASVGTLAAGVAHEINNPLAYISANLEFILAELKRLDRAEFETKVSEISLSLRESLEGASRIATIVRDLKTFSRGDPESSPTPVDLRKVVELACKMASNIIRHRAHLTMDCAPVPPVKGNEGRLCQVFLNLLVNAAEAIPESGHAPGDIHLRLCEHGPEQVLVEIQDNGAGMSPETLARIFDPFFTTKPFGVGTGLGLSICHGIISAVGGSISVQSELGKGTTFRVVLGVHAGTAAVSAPGSVVQSKGPRGKLLVIDDEMNVTVALQRVLGLSHDVTSVNCAADALRLLEAGRAFDLILCDVMMPEMSGLELRTRLLERHPEHATRVVFMTGGAFTPKTRAQLDEVPNALLTKPFDIRELLKLVEGAVTQASA